MDAITYRLSHLYLSRYRSLRVLQDVVKYDSEHSDGPTPQELRNPKWFAAVYFRMLRHALQDESAAIHLSSDSEQSDSEDEFDTRPVRPNVRRPLHHHTCAEILVLFAKHAEWLVEDQRRRRKGQRYFDLDVWQNWVFTVRNARHRAHGNEDAFLAQFADNEESEEEAENDGRSMEVDDDMVSRRGSPRFVGAVKRKATSVRCSLLSSSQARSDYNS